MTKEESKEPRIGSRFGQFREGLFAESETDCRVHPYGHDCLDQLVKMAGGRE